MSVKNFLWGYRQVSSAPHADKAKELYELIKGFGTDLDRLSYSAESAQMKKLIEELEKTENKKDIDFYIELQDLVIRSKHKEAIEKGIY